jgi:hypothetical protein
MAPDQNGSAPASEDPSMTPDGGGRAQRGQEGATLAPADVLLILRASGVIAHLATLRPAPPDGRTTSVSVFLEGNLCQGEEAAEVLLSVPGVVRVSFSGSAIIVVTSLNPLPGS